MHALWIDALKKPQAEIIVEKLDLHRVVVRRLFRLGAAIDDDLMKDVELGAEPVLPREPLQVGRIVGEHFVEESALVLAEGDDLGAVVGHSSSSVSALLRNSSTVIRSRGVCASTKASS